MARTVTSKTRPLAASGGLQAISPKTIAAVALMALMGVLWLRVLIGGKAGPEAAQAAEKTAEPAAQTAPPLRIRPVALPVVEGRHNRLACDFFSPDNWPGFASGGAVARTPSDIADPERLAQRNRLIAEELAKTLNLDAILHGKDGAPAQVCIDGRVLTRGQTLTVKRQTEQYELTVSDIDEDQVVLTWNNLSVVLKMTQPERVD